MPPRRERSGGIASLHDLIARVDATGLPPVVLLAGDDRRQVDEALALLRERAVPRELEAFNCVGLRGGEASFEDVVLACSILPMLGDRRLVSVREPERLTGDPASLAAYMKNPSPTSLLLLAPLQLDRRLGWVKAMEASALSCDFAAPAARDVEAWARRALKAKGLTIEPSALAMLQDLVQAETLLLGNELEKLTLCCAGAGVVTAADVEAVLGRTRTVDAWSLTNAVEDGDPAAAVAALRRLLDQGAAIPMLVGMLDWCLGRLLASEPPRTFPARLPVLERRRKALRGRAARVMGLVRDADRLFRTTGGDAAAALERAVLAASAP